MAARKKMPAPRITAAEARAIDAEVDRAVRRARSSAKAYAKKRNASGLVTAAQAARTKRGTPRNLAAFYKAYPEARRSKSGARHLQGMQGVAGRGKSPFAGFSQFGKVSKIMGFTGHTKPTAKSQRAFLAAAARSPRATIPLPKVIRRVRRRVKRKA